MNSVGFDINNIDLNATYDETAFNTTNGTNKRPLEETQNHEVNAKRSKISTDERLSKLEDGQKTILQAISTMHKNMERVNDNMAKIVNSQNNTPSKPAASKTSFTPATKTVPQQPRTQPPTQNTQKPSNPSAIMQRFVRTPQNQNNNNNSVGPNQNQNTLESTQLPNGSQNTTIPSAVVVGPYSRPNQISISSIEPTAVTKGAIESVLNRMINNNYDYGRKLMKPNVDLNSAEEKKSRSNYWHKFTTISDVDNRIYEKLIDLEKIILVNIKNFQQAQRKTNHTNSSSQENNNNNNNNSSK